MVRDAWNAPPAAGATLTVPSDVLPVTKLTEPLGMPTPVELTVTVKVTGAPVTALDGFIFGVIMTSVEVVGAVVTISDSAEVVLPSNVLDPR